MAFYEVFAGETPGTLTVKERKERCDSKCGVCDALFNSKYYKSCPSCTPKKQKEQNYEEN